MKQKILRLPEAVINQIAAGEVVENPASVVKELIENSLDSKAQAISVAIAGGGFHRIRVEDDGCGMSSEDALLSLEKHATSKIRVFDDLEALVTMGFRGEALAAIASVCHLEMQTADQMGTRLLVEAGKVICVEPCARNRGTTVEVRSLFFNVPARKKFQKSPSFSASQITRVVETIALAHPEVAFSLNDKAWVPSGQKERVEEILGKHEHELKGNGISGFIAAPSQAMATRTGQYIYINRRPIFSPLISKAVKEGFGTRIATHAYPRFVLFLQFPPDVFDINIHPQKKEVRFRDESKVFRLVQKAVENAFSPSISFSEPIAFTSPSFSLAEEPSPPPLPLVEPEFDFVFQDRPLAILGSYLLLQKETLVLVDLRAAHARLLFEALQYEKGDRQALIWPLEVPLAEGEEEIAEKLSEMGIECRVLQKTLAIDALPPFLSAAHFPEFFANWREGKKIESVVTRFCRSIQKTFSLEEATLLWRALQKCRDPLYDPLGNVIWAQIREKDFAKILSR